MLTGPELSGPRPSERLAIAFSGGGDSTALLHLCRNLKPSPLVLIVDHALRPGSGFEVETAKSFAQSLGLETKLLTWQHDGVTSGIQEKARRARYGLMGNACRSEGIRYLLTGHTQDDQAETLLMRYERGTEWRGAAGILPKVYAPVWPELARITLLRPLLGASRKCLRDYNRAQNISWAEDPSNSNPKFDRIKARQYLSSRPTLSAQLVKTAMDLQKGREVEKLHLAHAFAERVFVLPHSGALKVNGKLPPPLWKLILNAAAGNDAPISDKAIKSLITALRRADFSGQTLGSAFVKKSEDSFLIGPDPSIYKSRNNKRALGPMPLTPGRKHIWDGRFEIETAKSGLAVVTAFEALKRLNSEQSKSLKALLKGVEFSDSMPIILVDNSRANKADFSISGLIRSRIAGVLNID